MEYKISEEWGELCVKGFLFNSLIDLYLGTLVFNLLPMLVKAIRHFAIQEKRQDGSLFPVSSRGTHLSLQMTLISSSTYIPLTMGFCPPLCVRVVLGCEGLWSHDTLSSVLLMMGMRVLFSTLIPIIYRLMGPSISV